MIVLQRLYQEEDGQSLVEYTLILGIIAIVLILLGSQIRAAVLVIWNKIIGALNT